MFQTLLVPLDGSAFAEQALPFALSIARRANAKLDLMRVHALYCIDNPARVWAPFDPAADAEFRGQELGYLDELARRHTGECAVKPTCAVVNGFAADAILGRAKEVAADLIVMTTHGRGPLSRAFLGSVADELVRRCSIPVLLVRPQEALPDLHKEPSVTKVLVPLDRSPTSMQIIQPAIKLGSAWGASYIFLHVVHPDTIPARETASERPAALRRTWQEREAEEALAYLEHVADWFRGPAVKVQTRVVVRPHVATAILDEARAQSCDVIAFASHGRVGLKRMLLGSITDKVLRGASCPVLIYREPGE